MTGGALTPARAGRRAVCSDRSARVAHSATRLLVLPLCLIAFGHSVRSEEARKCHIDQLAGEVQGTSSAKRVYITVGTTTTPYGLPVCLEYKDQISVDKGATAHVITASKQFDVSYGETPQFLVPAAMEQAPGSWHDFFATLKQGITGPTETVPLYAASRGAPSCPAGHGTPPPLSPVARLSGTEQRIGADLRAIVAVWRQAPEPRLVRVRLLRQDGSLIVGAASCRSATLPLLLRSSDLHPGDQLSLQLTDEQGGSLRYNLTVVSPDGLPQPPEKFPEDWLVATWRLSAGPPDTVLDSVARLGKASETSFGAQRMLGAVVADAPF